MIFPYLTEAEFHEKQRYPITTFILIIVIIAIFFPTYFAGSISERDHIFLTYGLNVYDYHWWNAITCTFLHAGFIHLLGNLLFLWIYGGPLEKLIGTIRFNILYWSGALISAHFHAATIPDLMKDIPMVGASGAISALMGTFIIMLPHAKLRCLFFSIISFRPIEVVIPAWTVLALWLGGQLIYSLGLLGDFFHIAFWAHLSGFALGAAFGSFFQWEYKRELKAWQAKTLEPLSNALASLQKEDIQNAWEQLQLEKADMHPEVRQSYDILYYLTVSRLERQDQKAEFLKGIARFRDYRNTEAIYSLYLHFIQHVPSNEIPILIHREGAFQAFSAGDYKLSLWAFKQSMAEYNQDQLPRMMRAIRTMLQKDYPDAEIIRLINQQVQD